MNTSRVPDVNSLLTDETMAGGRVDHQTLSGEAVNRIRAAILQGKLKPGERLIQSRLAEEMGMSRIPLREALKELETEGLIRVEPYRGAVVSSFDEHDVREIYCLRALLESLAAEIALPRLTDDDIVRLTGIHAQMEQLHRDGDFEAVARVGQTFHMAIYAKSGWGRLVDIIGQLWARRPQVDVLMAERASLSLQQHRQILDAIRERDAWKAARLIRIHIESAEEALISEMAGSKSSGPSK